MKQVLIRQGNAVVEDIPAPITRQGTVLVNVEYSAISIGTEVASMNTSSQPLWRRALQQPDNVRKVIEMIASAGVRRTRSLIKARLSAGNTTGYSCAGTILAVGEGITDLEPGMRVACAGAQYAHHAELVCVPRNLVVPVPAELDLKEAATVTLGAIALQGVRRANPTLGETFIVIGLGILGQLTAQLLKANGCRVIGLDLEPHKIELAKTLGSIDDGFCANENCRDNIARLTQGNGVDGVIITAASSSNEIISDAFTFCRKKGRVVLVGDVGLKLKRADFYAREIDLLISCSYGPGRYDENYEEKGHDYPIGYVRWTENRNMQEYLHLIAQKKCLIAPLIEKIYPLVDAESAYNALKKSTAKPLLVLLEYPQNTAPQTRKIVLDSTLISRKGIIRTAVIGAGGFAKGVHLPNLDKLHAQFHIQAIVSQSGHNARATAELYQANYATTDLQEVLNDPEIDALIITTRHHLHASYVLAALKAGKHVLVEKPLVITQTELEDITAYFQQTAATPLLLTGFNRRFSPYVQRMKKIMATRTSPMQMTYTMNAGFIAADHWVHGAEGGGRNLGEACHIYDLFVFLADAAVTAVQAMPVKSATGYYKKQDNFSVILSFADGSTATLTYTAMGHKKYPKETMQIFCENKVLLLDDYKRLEIMGTHARGLKTTTQEKGQYEELQAFGKAIQSGSTWPIPLWQQLHVTQIALDVEKQLLGA